MRPGLAPSGARLWRSVRGQLLLGLALWALLALLSLWVWRSVSDTESEPVSALLGNIGVPKSAHSGALGRSERLGKILQPELAGLPMRPK